MKVESIILLLVFSIISCNTYKPIITTINNDSSNTVVKTNVSLKLNTVPVDSHGRALDTDNDGVPDFRDKEILTELRCFPVDEDGMGYCPEPECCYTIFPQIINPLPNCNLGHIEIRYFNGSYNLTKKQKLLVDSVATFLKNNPGCHIKIGAKGGSKKASINLAWERINSVLKYFEHLKISPTRINFSYDLAEEFGLVAIQGFLPGEPSIPDAPRPKIKRNN